MTVLTVPPAYRRVIERCRPYLVTSSLFLDAFDLRPFGVAIAPSDIFDPLRMASAPFLNLLERLDRLTFGPVGMPMPRWVCFDCAEMPGGIFGLAAPAAEIERMVRGALEVEEGYEGLVPLSMYIAIPMLEEGMWLGYTLCSLNEVSPGSGPAGLRTLTLALALKVFRVRTAFGTIQWYSPKLNVYSRFGPLELHTSYTPAHTESRSFTFSFSVTDECLSRALGQPRAEGMPQPQLFLDIDDREEMRRLQREIEEGRRFLVIGPHRQEGSFIRVPLAEERPGTGGSPERGE